MKKYYLNADLSKEVFDYFSANIKIKECYNNVFKVFSLSPKTFREGKWKVAYGYVETLPLVYCRHCFILDENGGVIDPTNFAQSEPPQQRQYYVTAIFEDMDEYLTAIEDDNYMPALEKHLKAQDIKACQWAMENGLIFIG